MSLVPGMGLQPVAYGETTATKRRLYFHVEDASGDPVGAMAGEQPQISVNGANWTADGIGVLVAISSGTYGDYYAEVTSATLETTFAIVQGRFKHASSVECRALNTLLRGGLLEAATACHTNKVETDRSTAETKVYDGDGTTVLSTRKREAVDADTVQIAPV